MAQTTTQAPAVFRLTTGERIRVLRGRRPLTRPALAAEAHVSLKSLGRYERDEIDPQSTVLRRIAIALDTTTDYLVGLTEDPTAPSRNAGVAQSHAVAA
jgi:transcriptional regulator with XRE-family HTH domain